MNTAAEYRQLAENQRLQAQVAGLPMVRERHLNAAEKWDILAEQIEHCQHGLVVANGAIVNWIH